MRDVATHSYDLSPIIYHLGLNLDVSFRRFTFEYSIDLLFVIIICLQADQICPEVQY